MKTEIKEEWIYSLLGGEYKQGRAWLRVGDEFCCLGILCDRYAKQNGVVWESDDGFYRFLKEASELPVEVMKWAGLQNSVGFFKKGEPSLVELNDNGMPFAEIAEVIEKHF